MTELEIETQRLKIEEDRLDLDKEKARQDSRFWVKNFGTVITTIVSLTAVLVTFGQVWVAKISQEKELASVNAQKEKELVFTQAQKEKELSLLVAQQEREWNLNAAKFVSEHADVIFGNDKEKRSRIAKVMIVTFPRSITDALFQKLENIPDPSGGANPWRIARTDILPKIDDPPAVEANINQGSLSGEVLEVNTNRPISGARITINNTQRPAWKFQATTDAAGHFQIDNLPAAPLGLYSLIATHSDYQIQGQFINVSSSGPTTISLSARPKTTSP